MVTKCTGYFPGIQARRMANGKTKTLSVVVPVYNSEKSLEELYSRLQNVFSEMGTDFEIIFVNDKSKDNSLSILKKLHASHQNIIVVDLMKNFGQHNAILCGFRYCTGDYVVTIDDDLQHRPEEIPKLYSKIIEGYDAVIGAYSDKEDKFHKNLGSAFIRKVNHKIFHLEEKLEFSSFRVIRKEIVDQIKNIRTAFPYITGMILSVTLHIANVNVSHDRRKYGKSGYKLSSLLELTYNLMINYSSIPLRFFSYLGLAVSVVSFLIGSFFMVKQLLSGSAPTGWTSLVVLLSFYNTIILLIFFFIGVYISRVLREISHHRQFIEKEVLK